MACFLFVAIAMVHHHTNADLVRRKSNEAEDYIGKLNMKIEVVEQEIIDLKISIDELEEEIATYQGDA